MFLSVGTTALRIPARGKCRELADSKDREIEIPKVFEQDLISERELFPD